MNFLKAFDNDGLTADQYTILFDDGSVYSMSKNANMPNGVCSYSGDHAETFIPLECENVVPLDKLPISVQRQIRYLQIELTERYELQKTTLVEPVEATQGDGVKLFESDDTNPNFIFQGVNTTLLIAAMRHEIDLDGLVRSELVARGLGLHGQHVGHSVARELWDTYYWHLGLRRFVAVPEK